MTVTYTHEVATGRGFGNFWRLLRRWRGSIYKVVIPELIVYAALFAVVSLTYRLWIVKEDYRKDTFEKWVKYCADYAGVIPVSFVLGFYVSQIVTRWWSQAMTIPWPDAFASLLASTFHGADEEGRIIKRTIVRYINCTFVMVLAMVSSQAKARFPTLDHLVVAGLLTVEEKLIIEKMSTKTELPLYWVPVVWAGNLCVKGRYDGRVKEDLAMMRMINTLAKFRSQCGDILMYDWVCIPLVYTQVVTLAVYLYFGAALFGKQFIDDEHELDLYIPMFLFLEFFFYTGWLKVAETMVNPFGEDDDDFEINWLIDRNVAVSLMIVDGIGESIPTLTKDIWWDEGFPTELPYTVAAQKFRTKAGSDGLQGSAAMQKIPMDEDQAYVVLPNKTAQNANSVLEGRFNATRESEDELLRPPPRPAASLPAYWTSRLQIRQHQKNRSISGDDVSNYTNSLSEDTGIPDDDGVAKNVTQFKKQRK